MQYISRAVSRVARMIRRSWRRRSAFARLASLPEVHPKYGPFFKTACRAMYEGCERSNMRPSYLLGSVVGAMQAKACDERRVALMEFGVAHGDGYRVLLDIGDLITAHFGLSVEVVGFDNRNGLPPPADYRDHPEIWSERQFAMGDAYKTLEATASERGGTLVIGDVAQTLREFIFRDASAGHAVIAFCSIDVDYYSSTVPITGWLGSLPPAWLLPATPLYFDDVEQNFIYSHWAGEALAISEFNASHEHRKIELRWRELDLYALQAFDHPVRQGAKKVAVPMEIFVDDLLAFWWR